MYVIFDLDGTLALNEHRQHFLNQTPKQWDEWNAACMNDTPHKPIVQLMDIINDDMRNYVEIWTGRSESQRASTVEWLYDHTRLVFEPDALRMRPINDHRDDTALKMGWLSECMIRPDLVFEDRNRMVEMWRSQGIVCCQVAPGDF